MAADLLNLDTPRVLINCLPPRFPITSLSSSDTVLLENVVAFAAPLDQQDNEDEDDAESPSSKHRGRNGSHNNNKKKMMFGIQCVHCMNSPVVSDRGVDNHAHGDRFSKVFPKSVGSLCATLRLMKDKHVMGSSASSSVGGGSDNGGSGSAKNGPACSFLPPVVQDQIINALRQEDSTGHGRERDDTAGVAVLDEACFALAHILSLRDRSHPSSGISGIFVMPMPEGRGNSNSGNGSGGNIGDARAAHTPAKKQNPGGPSCGGEPSLIKQKGLAITPLNASQGPQSRTSVGGGGSGMSYFDMYPDGRRTGGGQSQGQSDSASKDPHGLHGAEAARDLQGGSGGGGGPPLRDDPSPYGGRGGEHSHGGYYAQGAPSPYYGGGPGGGWHQSGPGPGPGPSPHAPHGQYHHPHAHAPPPPHGHGMYDPHAHHQQHQYPPFEYDGQGWSCPYCIRIPLHMRSPGYFSRDPPPPDFIAGHYASCQEYHYSYRSGTAAGYYPPPNYGSAHGGPGGGGPGVPIPPPPFSPAGLPPLPTVGRTDWQSPERPGFHPGGGHPHSNAHSHSPAAHHEQLGGAPPQDMYGHGHPGGYGGGGGPPPPHHHQPYGGMGMMGAPGQYGHGGPPVPPYYGGHPGSAAGYPPHGGLPGGPPTPSKSGAIAPLKKPGKGAGAGGGGSGIHPPVPTVLGGGGGGGAELPEPEFDCLVQPEDKPLLTEYFYVLNQQLKPVRFKEADRKSRGGKRKDIAVGFGGIACVHCYGKHGARKFFWADVDRLANSFSEIPAHVMKCSGCPDYIKAQLAELKARHSGQMANLPRGWQKIFFRRMWRRIHDHELEQPPGQEDAGGTPGDANGKSPGRGGGGGGGAVLVLPPTKHSLLAMPEDRQWLSDLDCQVRTWIEVFVVGYQDVVPFEKATGDTIREGQVGLRCVFCSNHDHGHDHEGGGSSSLLSPTAIAAKAKEENAVQFPPSMDRIYESVRELQRLHFHKCANMPEHLQKKVAFDKSASSLSSILRRYYVISAKAHGLGMYDATEGSGIFSSGPSTAAAPPPPESEDADNNIKGEHSLAKKPLAPKTNHAADTDDGAQQKEDSSGNGGVGLKRAAPNEEDTSNGGGGDRNIRRIPSTEESPPSPKKASPDADV
jgi:hypothetical protein